MKTSNNKKRDKGQSTIVPLFDSNKKITLTEKSLERAKKY
jgi:hypothetical protein